MKKTFFITASSLIVSLCLSYIIAQIYRIDNEMIKRFVVDVKSTTIVSEECIDCAWGIDPIEISDGELIITGWIVPKNKDITQVNRCVLLQDENNTFWKINTIYEDRNLTCFFDAEYNYDIGGIRGQCNIDKLNDHMIYRVYLYMNDDKTPFLFDTKETVALVA